MLNGRLDLANQCFNRVIEINPRNMTAREKLDEIKAQKSEVIVV